MRREVGVDLAVVVGEEGDGELAAARTTASRSSRRACRNRLRRQRRRTARRRARGELVSVGDDQAGQHRDRRNHRHEAERAPDEATLGGGLVGGRLPTLGSADRRLSDSGATPARQHLQEVISAGSARLGRDRANVWRRRLGGSGSAGLGSPRSFASPLRAAAGSTSAHGQLIMPHEVNGARSRYFQELAPSTACWPPSAPIRYCWPLGPDTRPLLGSNAAPSTTLPFARSLITACP